jgi:BASS family bile acid:Na+ symporter
MSFFHILAVAPLRAFATIGRHGTLAVAASIFVGLLVPQLAAQFKPLLGPSIVVLLALAFLRVDPAALRNVLRQPRLVGSITIWTMVIVPAVLGTVFVLLGLNAAIPWLYLILVLQGTAPVLMSSPAFAALLGLDVALTLAGLLVCTAVAPLTGAAYTHIFLDNSAIEPVGFGLKLFAIIAGSALAGALIRWLAGQKHVEAQRDLIDGLSVLTMFIFAVAAMDGVTAHVLSQPLLVLLLLLLAFLLSLGLIAVTTLVFLPIGKHRAFAVGLLAGNRNIGVVLAATGFAVPDLAWLYFALAQFPIYLLPALLKPLAKRLGEDRSNGG